MSDEWLAPVEHLVVHVDDPRALTPGIERLRELAAAGVIQVLDLEVVRPVAPSPGSGSAADAPEPGIEALDLGTFGDEVGVDLHALDGTWSGLLDDDDLRAALVGAGPGTLALVVVYEVVALAPMLAAFEGGAVHVASTGSVDDADLAAAVGTQDGGTR